MEAAGSVGEFFRDPLGKYVAGHCFVVWVHNSALAGSVYFGRPDPRDYPALLEMFPLAQHPSLARPFDVLVDASGLAGLTSESFKHLGSYVDAAMAFAPLVRRVAIIRPSGLIGATVAGVFYDVVRTEQFRVGLFADRAEGLAWLQNPKGAAAGAELEAVLSSVLGTPPLLAALRQHLMTNLGDATLPASARHLSQSERSLQRRLREWSTSFRIEMDRARVRVAESLLVDGDEKLEAIALQVGCSSLSQFGALFRRATGETPSDFRARRKS